MLEYQFLKNDQENVVGILSCKKRFMKTEVLAHQLDRKISMIKKFDVMKVAMKPYILFSRNWNTCRFRCANF